MSREVVQANVARVVEGFRDTGYTFGAAIADLIDNSIDAGATGISIEISLDHDQIPVVKIIDNGKGMDLAALRSAMVYGAEGRDDPHRLGRFGLGLKTASTSFCRRLTVISRDAASPPGALYASTWDLDTVIRENDWLLDIDVASADERDVHDDGQETLAGLVGSENPSGTTVLWTKVDRLLQRRHGGDLINRPLALNTRVNRLRLHLRTVFQRFLDERDNRARHVRIFLNGQELQVRDPFCETWIRPVENRELKLHLGDAEGQILIRAFILPAANEIEDPEYGRESAISLKGQGIYVYRENRLIEGPDWLGVGVAETHLNGARIELSFDAPLDPLFGVGIKKSGLHLDVGFQDELEKFVIPIRREANQRARLGAAKQNARRGAGAGPAENTINATRGSLLLPILETMASGEVVLKNNRVEGLQLVDETGRRNPRLQILIDDTDTRDLHVATRDTLESGVLWQPSLGSGPGRTQVTLNVSHEWYRKAYLPNATNGPLVQALQFLFFALAQAEFNNTDEQLDDLYQEFRVEVSRNLRRLVANLPDPETD